MKKDKCTHGNGFCKVHQGDCEVHHWLMGDGHCTCKPCPKKGEKSIPECCGMDINGDPYTRIHHLFRENGNSCIICGWVGEKGKKYSKQVVEVVK